MSIDESWGHLMVSELTVIWCPWWPPSERVELGGRCILLDLICCLTAITLSFILLGIFLLILWWVHLEHVPHLLSCCSTVSAVLMANVQ